MSVLDGLLNVIGKFKTPPSVIDASPIKTLAVSLSMMVPIAVSVVFPNGTVLLPNEIVNVSLFSSIVSSVVATAAVAVVLPAKIVTVTGVTV